MLLGALVIGLGAVIHVHHVLPRSAVTVLARLSAAPLGTGWQAPVAAFQIGTPARRVRSRQ